MALKSIQPARRRLPTLSGRKGSSSAEYTRPSTRASPISPLTSTRPPTLVARRVRRWAMPTSFIPLS